MPKRDDLHATQEPVSTIPPVTVAFAHRGQDWIRGSEQCLLDLISGIDHGRFRPLLICEHPTLAQEATNRGAIVHQLDDQEDWGSVDSGIRRRIRREVLGVLRQCNASLIHANASTVLPVMLPIARQLRLPIVTHLHLPITDKNLRLNEFVHQSTITVGVAHHVIAPLRDDGVGEHRLRVIWNAVDETRLQHGDARGLRCMLGIPSDALVAGSVGSLIARKGHDVAIRALALARRHAIINHELIICGAGVAEAELRALAAGLGVASFVHFLGFRSDAGAIVRDAVDICIASAREEALPLNVLEAQWYGKYMIVSDIPAHREALTIPAAVTMVAVESVSALASALLQARNEMERTAHARKEMSLVARERFSMHRYLAEFQSLYDELLARPSGSYGWMRGSIWPKAYTQWTQRVLHRWLRQAIQPVTLRAWGRDL